MLKMVGETPPVAGSGYCHVYRSKKGNSSLCTQAGAVKFDAVMKRPTPTNTKKSRREVKKQRKIAKELAEKSPADASKRIEVQQMKESPHYFAARASTDMLKASLEFSGEKGTVVVAVEDLDIVDTTDKERYCTRTRTRKP